MQYEAVAVLPDGRTLTVTGTIQQCSNWADNVIRVNGECTITIREAKK